MTFHLGLRADAMRMVDGSSMSHAAPAVRIGDALSWPPGPRRSERERRIRTMTELSPEQAEYIGISVSGPYKPDHYRY